MLVLIGGILVVSFLYIVTSMKKDDVSNEKISKNEESSNDDSNMEYVQSTITKKYVCSKCGSKAPIAIKIEERVEESTTYEIIEENHVESSYVTSLLRYQNNDPSLRRDVVPFPEAGVDIIDRKLKNTKESLEREINEYHSHDNDILTYTESWTENWLFRKKDYKNHEKNSTPIKPVMMFVPNPKTTNYCRAMIGDRNIDEISDLSDDDDCFTDDTEDIVTRKDGNGMAKYIYDRSAKLLLDGQLSKHHDIENGVCQDDDDEDDDDDEVDGNDRLNGEDLITTPRNKSYRSELFIESCDVNQNFKLDTDDKSLLSDIDFHLFSPPKPGTIADREHRKWQMAVPLENNPYSEANLQKRLLERKYSAAKYSNNNGLLGVTRINSVVDKVGVENTSNDMIDFKSIDDPTIKNSSIQIVTNKPCENLIIDESKKKSQINGITRDDVDDNKEMCKNKSNESKLMKVTKNNTTIINDIDSSEEEQNEEKISLPSVKKLVEVFTTYQRERKIIVPKDKNTTTSNEMTVDTKRRNFGKIQPRPLHLHSLTARSLSKEFREGLR